MASSSVNVPTNPKIKEQDVNAKLQLYGIYSAFANGKVPSNKQIDVAMNTAYNWKGFTSPSKRLSAEGQALTNDLQKVIEQAKLLLLSKNEGNLIQDFIWQTQQIGAGDAQKPGAPIDKDTAKQHGNQALEGLRTLGQLLITNGQFRKLLSDASVLLRDIAGDAAQNAANKVNPSEDQLQNIDRPAEDNVWHEAPDLSKDNLKSQVQSRVPIGKKDVERAGQNAAQAANPDGSSDPAVAAQRAAQDQQQGTSQTDPRAGAAAAAKDLKETIMCRGEPTGSCKTFAGDVVATAKRDLKAGEKLDGEGGFMVYGKLMRAKDSLAIEGLPIGLAHGLVLKSDVRQGEGLSWQHVEWSEESQAVAIRREMETIYRDELGVKDVRVG